MRIAIVTPRMIVGGAEFYIITKSKFLIERGYNVIVLSAGGEGVNNLPNNVRHYNLPYIDDPPYIHSQREVGRLIDLLAKILVENSIEIVEAHNTYPLYYAAVACKVVGIICIYNLLNELSHDRQFVTNILLKDFSNSRRYFTLTSQMNEYVEQKLKKKLYPTIIPIPVTTLSPRECHDRRYILTVCRFSSDKLYVLYLIEGFTVAIKKGIIPKDFKLRIIGDGPLREQVEERVNWSNELLGMHSIQLLGTKLGIELEEQYCNCTLYVGMGTTVLQAAQYKKAIIKVGFESKTMKYAWGYWGEKTEDVHCIAANGKNMSERMLFEEALVIVSDNDKIKALGKKAYLIHDSHYKLEKTMAQWIVNYQRLIDSDKHCISNRLERIVNSRVFVLRCIRKIYQLIK